MPYENGDIKQQSFILKGYIQTVFHICKSIWLHKWNKCSTRSSRNTSKLHTLQTLYKHYGFVHAAKDSQ